MTSDFHMEVIINKYLLIISILPLLLGEEYPYPRCEWEKTEDCVTKISVYNIIDTSFEVFQLSPENEKANIVYCDWIENGFECTCSTLKCSPPVNATFHAFKSSSGKCLNITNLQLSYGSINGNRCTPNESCKEVVDYGTVFSSKRCCLSKTLSVIKKTGYPCDGCLQSVTLKPTLSECLPSYSNLSTNERAGSKDRSSAFPNDESFTSPPIVNKSIDEKRHEPSHNTQSDHTKMWVAILVTVAVLIVVIGSVLIICWRKHRKTNKESKNNESSLAHNPTEYHAVRVNENDSHG